MAFPSVQNNRFQTFPNPPARFDSSSEVLRLWPQTLVLMPSSILCSALRKASPDPKTNVFRRSVQRPRPGKGTLQASNMAWALCQGASISLSLEEAEKNEVVPRKVGGFSGLRNAECSWVHLG